MPGGDGVFCTDDLLGFELVSDERRVEDTFASSGATYVYMSVPPLS